MPRKKSADRAYEDMIKRNKPPKMHMYEVCLSREGGDLLFVTVRAERVESDCDQLQFFIGEDSVGVFQEWLYYLQDPLVPNPVVKDAVLPKDWGKLT